MDQLLKHEARDQPRQTFKLPTPLGVIEMLLTWMPGRNPFAAGYVYLRNHPGISLDFFEFCFVKQYLGWEEQPWLGSLLIKN